MFSSPRTNLFESDEGFSVEVLVPTKIVYREGDRSMKVYSELIRGGVAIWRETAVKWQGPHELEPVDVVKRDLIIERICRAIAFSGGEAQVIG